MYKEPLMRHSPSLLSIAAILVSTLATAACQRNYNAGKPLVAGQSSEVTAPSPTVMLGDAREAGCSATLVGPQLVVTAAHCVLVGAPEFTAPQRGAPLPPRSGLIVYFVRNFSAVTGTNQRRVAEFKAHPRSIFTNPAHGPIDASSSGAADIALLKLAEPAPSDYPIAKLSTMDAKILKGKELSLQGFGFTEISNQDFGTLREGMVNYYLRENPGEFYVRGANGNEVASCPGDSGGSLYYISGPGAQPLLLGVASRVLVEGGKCAGSNSIYGDIAYHQAWLKQTAAEWGLALN
jgi:hypothetical protein